MATGIVIGIIGTLFIVGGGLYLYAYTIVKRK